MRSKNRAFTLVELLVVIGIIAVLLSLLLPALSKARESGMQAVCASNLHQLAIASFNYSADNHGSMVPYGVMPDGVQAITISGVGTFAAPANINWDYLQVNFAGTNYFSFQDGLLGKYLKTDKVIQCPKLDGMNLPITDVPNTYGICNVLLTNIGQLTQGSSTACFADSIYYGTTGPGAVGFSRPTEIFKPSQGLDSFHGRHSNGLGNVAFYDGHVEAIPAQLRPMSISGTSATTFAVLQLQHIGPLAKHIDFTQIGSNSAYVSACLNQYDFYFWTNKYQKR